MVKPKILYVEDDKINAFVMEKMLGESFDIFLVRDGDAAIEESVHAEYDLVLMDINLGNGRMDGVESMKIIKDKNPHIKVIALTSYAMPGDKEKFIEMGFNGYISKPVDKATAIEVINNSLKSA